MGANMSIKVHILHRHQDKFPDYSGDVSDKPRKQFHQEIKTMEERYQGWWDKRMMADNYWSIKRDLNNIEHDRQSRKRKFYHSSYVQEGFSFAVGLLNDLMKILVRLGKFNRVIFKDLGFGCFCKHISQ